MRVLVIRTSAMGDVALTVPVIKSFIRKYPGNEVILLTKSAFFPFFSSVQELKLIDADFKTVHNGFSGLFTLYRQIIGMGRIDFVFDLHDVFRSRVIRFLFFLGGSDITVIRKGRKDKRNLIKGRARGFLKHTVERYSDVLSRAGFPVEDVHESAIIPVSQSVERIERMLVKPGVLNIGVAPYARHFLKMWPEKNMIDLLNLISENNRAHFYLFGGGEEEKRMLTSFAKQVLNSTIVAGELTLEEELALLSKLDFMICMDSSNMHLAALTGTKVISIWGGTHPAAGFGALYQPYEYSVQISEKELTCRPCTIYGKGTCRRGDLACMNWLTPQMVLEKLVKLRLMK